MVSVIQQLNEILERGQYIGEIEENDFKDQLQGAFHNKLGHYYQLYLFAITYVHTTQEMHWTVPLLRFFSAFAEERSKIRFISSRKMVLYGIRNTAFDIPRRRGIIEYMSDVLQNVESLTTHYPGHESFYDPGAYKRIHTLRLKGGVFEGMTGEPRAVLAVFRIILAAELFVRINPGENDDLLKDLIKAWWWNEGEFGENYPPYLGKYSIANSLHYPGVFGKLLDNLGHLHADKKGRSREDPRLILPYLVRQNQTRPWLEFGRGYVNFISRRDYRRRRSSAGLFPKQFRFPLDFDMPSNFNSALIATQKVYPGPRSASQAGDAKINTSGQVAPGIFDHSMMDYPSTIPEQSNEAAPYHNTVADTVPCLATGKGLERLAVKPNTFTVPDWSDSESSNEGAAPPPPPLPPSTTTSVSLPEETIATVSNNPLAPSAENVGMTFTGGASADVSVIGEVPGAAEELSGVTSAGNFGELPSPSAQKRDMLAAFQEALAFGSHLSRIEEEPPEDSAQKFPRGASVQVKHATSKRRDKKAVRFLMEDSITAKDFISHLSNPPVEARGTERLRFLAVYTELANKFEEIEETYTINQPEASHSSSTLSSPPTDLDTPTIPQPLPPPPTVHRRSGRERRAPERYDANHEPIQVKRKIKSDRAPKNKTIPNPKPTGKKHERSPIRKKKPTKKGGGARRSAPNSKSSPQQTVSVSSRGRVRLPTERYIP